MSKIYIKDKNGNYYIKLSDGRLWAPSCQSRGTRYDYKEPSFAERKTTYIEARSFVAIYMDSVAVLDSHDIDKDGVPTKKKVPQNIGIAVFENGRLIKRFEEPFISITEDFIEYSDSKKDSMFMEETGEDFKCVWKDCHDILDETDLVVVYKDGDLKPLQNALEIEGEELPSFSNYTYISHLLKRHFNGNITLVNAYNTMFGDYISTPAHKAMAIGELYLTMTNPETSKEGSVLPKKVLIFDVETSTRFAANGSILQLTWEIVDTSDWTTITKKNHFFLPDEDSEIDPESIAVNKLTNEKLIENGVSNKLTVLEDFVKDMDSVDVISGHNVSFDLQFVNAEWNKIKKESLHSYPVIDTMIQTKSLCGLYDKSGRQKNPTLEELANFLRVDIASLCGGLHDARTDVEVTKCCLKKLTSEPYFSLEIKSLTPKLPDSNAKAKIDNWQKYKSKYEPVKTEEPKELEETPVFDISPYEGQKNFLTGKSVCVTGEFNIGRENMEHLIDTLTGLKHQSSISGKTKFVIVGINPGPSKMAKVKELNKIPGNNIQTLSETDLFQRLSLWNISICGKFPGHEDLIMKLKSNGDLGQRELPNRNTQFVLLGQDLSEEVQDALDDLKFNGLKPWFLTIEEAERLAEKGCKDEFAIPYKLGRDFHLTWEHVQKSLMEMTPDKNPIAGKEVMMDWNFAGDYNSINQLTGCLGSTGSHELTRNVQIVLLSDNTIECLKTGTTNKTIDEFNKAYNKLGSDTFYLSKVPYKPLYWFLLEKDFLSWYAEWSKKANDEWSVHLYEKYVESKK